MCACVWQVPPSDGLEQVGLAGRAESERARGGENASAGNAIEASIQAATQKPKLPPLFVYQLP